jgi:hypothetical protein
MASPPQATLRRDGEPDLTGSTTGHQFRRLFPVTGQARVAPATSLAAAADTVTPSGLAAAAGPGPGPMRQRRTGAARPFTPGGHQAACHFPLREPEPATLAWPSTATG